ncbi:MAG: hypothetical protein EOM80_13060 [Erysipelotrichia bacterium]|nr:hypothetical protein [Erysipelotrichia bacterium]
MQNHLITQESLRSRLVAISQAGVFLAVLLAVQLIGLPNAITGVVVNGIFIFVLLQLGLRYAMMLALLSPIAGIISGHLPTPMYPLLPIIVCGNALLVLFYFLLRGYRDLLRIILPAFVKAVVIGGAGYIVIHILELTEGAKWLALPVLGLQFFTAAAGIVLGERLFSAFCKNSDAAVAD